MDCKIKKYILHCTLGITLILNVQFAFAAKKIEKLTSKEQAEQVSSEVVSVSPIGEINKHSVGIGIGQTMLMSDMGKNGEDQITWDLLYNYSASHSFDFFADLHHSNHELGNKKTQLTGLALGIKAKVFNFDSFSPFLLGGFGFYIPRFKVYNDSSRSEEIASTKSKVTFGTHFGGGADLKLNKNVAVGILAHYHNPFDVKQDESIAGVGNEVEGSYFKLLITAYYTF
jgi:hypothetical protein